MNTCKNATLEVKDSEILAKMQAAGLKCPGCRLCVLDRSQCNGGHIQRVAGKNCRDFE